MEPDKIILFEIKKKRIQCYGHFKVNCFHVNRQACGDDKGAASQAPRRKISNLKAYQLSVTATDIKQQVVNKNQIVTSPSTLPAIEVVLNSEESD